MNTKKRMLILVVVSLTTLALILGYKFVSSARAGVLKQSVESSSLTIAYPGHLTEDNGTAVSDGNYDFIFSLYDDATAGDMIWSEIQTGVQVHHGSFAVLLGSVNPIPETAFTAKNWLSVNVRGPADVNYIELTPRQLLDEIAYTSPAEASSVAGTCAHNHLYEEWIGNTPSYSLRVVNTGTGDGIRGVTSSTLPTYAGIYALNSATTGSGAGIYARSNSSAGYGVQGYNSAGIAIYGQSSKGVGVLGSSSTNNGLVGTTAVTATGMSGVYGFADNSYGVTGQSTNFFGVQARGYDASGDDNYGDLWLDGLRGEILTDQRLNLISNWNVNVDLDFDNDDNDAAFRIYANKAITSVFSVDEAGNMIATGTKSAEVFTANDGPRLLYAIESPEVWFEDIGSATLVDGRVEVPIEPIFAQTVNLVNYEVFLTPVSDVPVILYIVSKSPTSFIVQGVTLDGKSAVCNFDYRIVAKRNGYEDVRLQQPAVINGDVK